MPLAADELAVLADAALDAAARWGARRPSCASSATAPRRCACTDVLPETTADDTDFGMGVRVVAGGAVGFAASVDVRPEEAAALVARATEMAAVTGRAGGGRVELSPEPSHGDVAWSSAFEVDPVDVPMADKIASAGRLE